MLGRNNRYHRIKPGREDAPPPWSPRLALAGLLMVLVLTLASCGGDDQSNPPASEPQKIVIKDGGGNVLTDVSTVNFGTTCWWGNSVTTCNGVTVGATQSRTFTVENAGDLDLTLTGTPLVDITGGNTGSFTVAVQPGNPITGRASTNFTIDFPPVLTGAVNTRTGTVVVASDDADLPLFTFGITGVEAS